MQKLLKTGKDTKMYMQDINILKEERYFNFWDNLVLVFFGWLRLKFI